jgi:RimJ/RimL family protein N-acetyltransferase
VLVLTRGQQTSLRDWFLPDRPGPLVGLHVLQTGHGACCVDCWPEPRVVLAETGGNLTLVGDPGVLTPDELRPRLRGLVDAPPDFEPLLRAAAPELAVWARVILTLRGGPPPAISVDGAVRPLGATDADHLVGLSPEVAWITATWGGPAGLAASGHAWGAFRHGRLAAVACSFFVGVQYEDIGVVTEPAERGRGLSVACAGALCAAIRGRGRQPSWSTSPDNRASLRVAEKLGFVVQRHDRLLVVGQPIPVPARDR